MTFEDKNSIQISRNAWVRFAMNAAERWLAASGDVSSEMYRFANYIRELRYRTKYTLAQISEELGVPYEELAVLEQGLLKPSEVSNKTWLHLMRLLEGRETLSQSPLEVNAVDSEFENIDPDELWAEGNNTDSLASMDNAPHISQLPIGVARIKVIGVGGGGSNAVTRMYRQRIPGVEYVAINTDAQHLIHLDVPEKVRIGDRLARGLGVGGDPSIGREAAQESREDLYDLLNGCDMVFIAAGMGGGTGTGAAPVVAEIAKEVGALTIAVVTKPFGFEGRRRSDQADQGIDALQGNVDTLILIPNDRLTTVSDEQMTAENAFRIADDVLRQGVQSIAELVTIPGEINLDFADVKAVMSGAGPAWMAIGHGRGENRAQLAAKEAMASPLLDAPIEGATRVLLNITGGTDVTLLEVQQASDFVARLVDPDANIIFGMVTDPKMEDEIRVTVIATGLPEGGSNILNKQFEEMFGSSPALEEEEPEPPVELPSFLKRLGFRRRNDY
ncbi:MAG: cell division protein FtsZ [Dehalococcoidia bacterium]|nr:cell division protein FtsZ [Dehalococcoidia bacterium]|tara:strand:+ start:263 stop:1768 length:1506 start_codon:yes stop_codon:yes gene_type:complete